MWELLRGDDRVEGSLEGCGGGYGEASERESFEFLRKGEGEF